MLLVCWDSDDEERAGDEAAEAEDAVDEAEPTLVPGVASEAAVVIGAVETVLMLLVPNLWRGFIADAVDVTPGFANEFDISCMAAAAAAAAAADELLLAACDELELAVGDLEREIVCR